MCKFSNFPIECLFIQPTNWRHFIATCSMWSPNKKRLSKIRLTSLWFPYGQQSNRFVNQNGGRWWNYVLANCSVFWSQICRISFTVSIFAHRNVMIKWNPWNHGCDDNLWTNIFEILNDKYTGGNRSFGCITHRFQEHPWFLLKSTVY